MNIFQEIKAFFVVEKALNEIVKGAKQMSGTKPWYTRSEFWMDVATKVGLIWGTVQGFIPPKYSAIIAASGTAVYVIARTVAKAVADIQTAKAMSTTVTTTQPVTTVTTPA